MMKNREKYFDVIDALKKLKDRMSKKKATEAIFEDTKISRQTILNAIDSGIRSGKISVEESLEGKRKSLLISIPTEIKDNEEWILAQLDKMFSKYEKKFELFKTTFKKLETDEKSDGIDAFLHFLLMADNLISYYSKIFRKDGKWHEFSKTLGKWIEEINSSAFFQENQKDTLKILEYLVEQREYDVVDAFDEIEDFIEDSELEKLS